MYTVTVTPDIEQIGFFSDLHGDTLNLMKMLKANPDIKHWFCAGDLVDMFKAAHYNQPALRLARQYGIKCVLGNHEKSVLINESGELDPDNKAFLKSMPLIINISFSGLSISVLHAARDNLEMVMKPEAGEGFYSHFDGLGADIIVLGHTHRPFILKHKGVVYINPGLLGAQGKGASYILLNGVGKAELFTL